MGVCGCGKTAVGRLLAAQLGGLFEDADDFHTEAAKDKMRAGTPLTDDDRRPWYARLRARVLELRDQTPHYVLACSALKQVYRDWLRDGDTAEQLVFVHLDGSFDLIHGRMSLRKDHYMPVSLLHSQFATLEPLTDGLRISIEPSPEQIAQNILEALPS